jgi:16S rRNA (guanine527-N7)-methyltransferase
MHSSAQQPHELIRGDSRFGEYERLLAGWPGLVSGPPLPLIEDSLVLLAHLQGARRLVDVGSGGGMPGIPLKLACPELQVTLLEADRRKAGFLLHAAARLGLEVQVVAERAESAGRGALRERFDVAVCRALAAPPVLLELCLPLVRVGGRVLAMRAGGSGEPGTEASPDLPAVAATLGGGRPEAVPAPSPARDRGSILVVPKLAPTPEAYPRRPGQPNRRPLAR